MPHFFSAALAQLSSAKKIGAFFMRRRLLLSAREAIFKPGYVNALVNEGHNMNHAIAFNFDHLNCVGESAAFQAVLKRARKMAKVPRPILIRGERGAGKDLLARFIHQAGDRSGRAFVVMHCAVVPDEFFATDFLGREKETHVDAQPGKLELANKGTLFLNEIANLSRATQEKLLRVIEHKKFEKVGGAEAFDADVHFIIATNAPLEEMMDSGEFLPELYHRLSFAELILPPLRRRREDIPALIAHFVQQLHFEIPNLEQKSFTPAAIKDLQAYHWPGNIRQLKNLIEQLYLTDEDGVIQSSDLPLALTTVEPLNGTFSEKVLAFEKTLLLNAIKDAHGNQRLAAQRLGLPYEQFREYYRKYHLHELMA